MASTELSLATWTTTAQDDHHVNQDGHGHDDEHGELFSETGLSKWNIISSLIVLTINEIVGLLANSFILYTIAQKQIGSETVSPILTGIAIKNITALLLFLPLATIMIADPPLIKEETCYIQEIGTFIVLYASLLFPSVLSVDRLDVIQRPRRRLFNRTKIICIMLVASIVSILLGFFPLVIHNDSHGCHLWSTRVDSAIWQYVYMLLICFSFSLIIIVYSYIQIYRYTKTHVDSLGKHKTLNSGPTMDQHHTKGETISSPPYVQGHVRMRMDTHVILPCVFTIVIVIVCWTPWLIVNSIIANIESGDAGINPELRVVTLVSVYIPISSDPLIFILGSSKGRKAIWKLIGKDRGHGGVSDIPHTFEQATFDG